MNDHSVDNGQVKLRQYGLPPEKMTLEWEFNDLSFNDMYLIFFYVYN